VERLQEENKMIDEEPHGLISTINDDDNDDNTVRGPICRDALSAASKKKSFAVSSSILLSIINRNFMIPVYN
jgi:hypothetical protein